MLASFRSSGGLCTCMSPTSEWIQSSQSHLAKRFFTTRPSLQEPYAQTAHCWSQPRVPRAGFAIGYYDLFSVILSCGQRLSLFSSFSPPSLLRGLTVVVESVPPLSFLPEENKKQNKKDMPKRENARKVKPCYNNTCIVVLIVLCSTYIGKSAESNTPIFYTAAAAAFAPHPHTIRLV